MPPRCAAVPGERQSFRLWRSSRSVVWLEARDTARPELLTGGQDVWGLAWWDQQGLNIFSQPIIILSQCDTAWICVWVGGWLGEKLCWDVTKSTIKHIFYRPHNPTLIPNAPVGNVRLLQSIHQIGLSRAIKAFPMIKNKNKSYEQGHKYSNLDLIVHFSLLPQPL